MRLRWSEPQDPNSWGSNMDHVRLWLADGSVFWSNPSDYDALKKWLAEAPPESVFELTDIYHGRAIVVKHWVMGISEWSLEGYKNYLEHNKKAEDLENQYKKKEPWE